MITAEEAKKITQAFYNENPEVNKTVETICKAIRLEAEKGLNTMAEPDKLIISKSKEMKKAVYQKLEAMGFKIKHNGANDQRDPRDTRWDSVEW